MKVATYRAIAVARSTASLRRIVILFSVALFAAVSGFSQQSDHEKAVWKLESSYWDDVKALDLDSYRALWHENFVGWPYSNSQPARKDHITDWIKAHTDTGETLAWFELKQADSRATENLVVTEYWLTSLWADKAGHGDPITQRVTHTWIKTANGWEIIAGMSARVPEN
jgi:ketosteroid isomerase-like protein